MPEKRIEIAGLGLATLDIVLRGRPGVGSSGRFAFDDVLLEGGGPVATAMAAASRLGARTGYIGTAGTDFAGECKLLSLTKYAVDVSHVVRRPGPETQVVMVWVDAHTGERSFTTLSEMLGDPLRPEELDRDYITRAGYLHLDGCHAEAAFAAARCMREGRKQVVLDAATTSSSVSERMRKLIPYVDVLICGSGFAQALTGCGDVSDACRLAVKLGPQTVVQTEGADGSYTACPSGEFHTPAFEVDVVDTTGAGDVFHGAYIVGLLKGWRPEQIAVFASAAAAMACTALGGRAGVGGHPETLAFCRHRGANIDG
ncbi:MAG: carbohydrate kinase family protein [Candidatus Brocadiae bacterium]|nr:carbohydrate kinase family protein [Candidatus Brocadiia bacterium]